MITEHKSNTQEVKEHVFKVAESIEDGDQVVVFYLPKDGKTPDWMPNDPEALTEFLAAACSQEAAAKIIISLAESFKIDLRQLATIQGLEALLGKLQNLKSELKNKE